MSSVNELVVIYEKAILHGSPQDKDQALDDAAESALFDGIISREQYNALLKLYASVTGDTSVLSEIL